MHDGGPAGVPVAPYAVGFGALRRLGLTGALLMAVGALGAGALPTPNPLGGLRLVGLPARNPTISLALAYAGLVLLVVAWWRVLARLRSPDRPPGRELARAALSWLVPLALAPPMFSRDVYSYLAQGATLARGLDPYKLGPADALGIDDTLVRSIPDLWRHTPSPYGPLFLLLGRATTAVTGEDVILGVLAYRALALVGLGLVVWALPRLARRAGADPDQALWLGAANPLVLFHVVSGAHNDGLMIGMMLAGLEIGLRGRRSALVAGTALIVAASAVKAPAVLVLPYLWLAVARRSGGRFGGLASTGGWMAAAAAGTYVPLSAAAGVGPGWVAALEVPGSVVSFLSVTTDLGVVAIIIGVVTGLGAHVDADLALFHGLGVVVAAILVVRSLLAVLRRRVDPVVGLAVGMAAVALLAVQTQPWYLLWALAPAAATGHPRLRQWLGLACGVLAVLVPPTGGDFLFRGYQLVNACAAATLLLVAAAALAEADLGMGKAGRRRGVRDDPVPHRRVGRRAAPVDEPVLTHSGLAGEPGRDPREGGDL